jgi:phosphate transport system substrate-binding protein
MRPEDLKKVNFIQFPVVIGGVVPVVNIQGIGEGDL